VNSEAWQQPSFDDAVSRLNSKSLRWALDLVSVLACIEFAGGVESPVYQIVNLERVRLLSLAVIKSKAAWYKGEGSLSRDLAVLLNGANSGLYDPRLEAEVVSGGERGLMLYELQRFFSRMAYLQIRPQRSPVIPLGQLLAIVESLPAGELVGSLPPHLLGDARAFPQVVRSLLGVNASDLVRTSHLVVEYYARLGTLLHKRWIEGAVLSTVRERAATLRALLERFEPHRRALAINGHVLERMFGEEATRHLEVFRGVFARTIEEHRSLLRLAPYQVGPETLRLSSLDRFPLVLGEDGRDLHCPSVRMLARSSPDVIHFALNEGCRAQYERVRGGLLELYLRRIVLERAAHLDAIPERKWPTGKGDMLGPDLVVVDHGPDPCVVGIEVKFRRMAPATRFELSDDDLSSNYGDLWKAVGRLPSKMDRVLALEGEYREHSQVLKRAASYPRWHVGVVGEAPFMLAELSRARALRDSTFPLFAVEADWAVMSAETFERLIEVVVQHAVPLASVLRRHQEDSYNLELSGSMAEMLGRVEIDEAKSVAAQELVKLEAYPSWLGT